jgi:hypothetical protein
MTRCACESPTLSPIKTLHLFVPEDCVLKSTLHIVECSSCGFIFTDTDQTQEEYDLYYSRQNMYYKPVTEITKYITDIFDVSQKYLNSESTIIDIGCGGDICHMIDYMCFKNTSMTGQSIVIDQGFSLMKI